MKISSIIVLSLLLILSSCNTFTPDDKKLRTRADYDLESTKEIIKDELKSDYTNSKLYFAMAQVLIKENNIELAIINLEKAIEYTPEPEYFKTLIPILLEKESWLEAEILADRLIEISPSYYHAYYYLVVSCVQQNKIDKAGKNLQTLSQINTGYPDLAYLKGRYYLAKKDTADAIYAFKTSIAQNQRTSELVFYLSDLYLGQGEELKAREIITQYETLPNLDQFQLHYTKAKFHLLDKKKKPYIAELRLADSVKKDCEVSLLLADYYVNRWKRDSARFFLSQTTQCPTDKRIPFYTGLIFFQTRNYEEALKNYKIAKDLDPEDRTIRWKYKQAYDSLYKPTIVPDSNSTDNQTENTLP